MRLIFAGTPDFARIALAQLHASGHEIALVLTQPDRQGGRGMRLQASAVKQFALEHGLALAQPRSLRLDGNYPVDAATARTALTAAQADAMVVAAYGLILPQWVLDLPAKGCFNIHASLLPRWRGAAPIQRAIEAGDAQTGVTLMQMDAGLDTGDLLLVQGLPVGENDTAASLHDKLAVLGAELMIQALEQAACGTLKPLPQPTEGVTYAHKIEKTEAPIDWAQSATLITQRIRAFNPFPGASGKLNGETLKIWRANVTPGRPAADVAPGTIQTVVADGIAVAALNSIVFITELQRAGGKRLPVADFRRGFEVQPGMIFELPDKGRLHV